MGNFTLTWKISHEHEGILIREFLQKEQISKTALTDIKFNGGSIKVNNLEVNVRYPLKLDDILTVSFPPEEVSQGLKGEDISLSLVYEDPYILVVNKPSGMSTIPSREHPVGSLANGIIGYYQKNNINATTHIVTRLDRDTSGLILVAKHRHVHHLFSKQLAKNLKRTYEAFSHGTFTEDYGTIKEPIARKQDSIIEREVNPQGQYACTHFKVINRYPNFTHLELNLETGRTHQIRVHLSYLGHPLLGDDLYGGLKWLMKRQALHCRKLTFFHPFKDEVMTFKAALPKDMTSILLNHTK